MLSVCHRHIWAAALLLLFCSASQIHASTITTAPKATSTRESTATCEFRTINYITDSLPQQCLKSSWSNSNGTSAASASWEEAAVTTERLSGDGIANLENASLGHDAQDTTRGETGSLETASTTSSGVTTAAESAEAVETDLESGELDEASFLSFEDWKKQTLEKAGQVDSNVGRKKPGESKKRDSENIHHTLDSLGDDGEIDLDFAAFRSGGKDEAQKVSDNNDAETRQESADVEEALNRKYHYRSKDAGRTCKERFSYASFDAGATILKTHPGAKNAKAVLIENKDSYMLSECSAENKFIIIELSVRWPFTDSN